MSSRRLPGKAMLSLIGLPIISLIMRRLKTSKLADKIILATSDKREDNVLGEVAVKENVSVYRGSLNDVLGRFVNAAKKYDFDYAVRVTGDGPFVDGNTLDYVLQKCIDLKKIGQHFDLVTTKPAFPHGIDYEIYPKRLLEKVNNKINLTKEEREHVTYYIYQKERDENFNIIRLEPPENLKLEKTIFLVDTYEDYEYMQKLTKGVTDIYTPVSRFIEIYDQLKATD